MSTLFACFLISAGIAKREPQLQHHATTKHPSWIDILCEHPRQASVSMRHNRPLGPNQCYLGDTAKRNAQLQRPALRGTKVLATRTRTSGQTGRNRDYKWSYQSRKEALNEKRQVSDGCDLYGGATPLTM
ncbi:hypothetical protein IWX90DRAFT_417996 [Phyllosticta citrichinensis]|uniref:Secreted protein n=1 Tax=Phyllosticta citrichinensis TaxID=1130410 RepID=A0ABR1XJG5_9PEZI